MLGKKNYNLPDFLIIGAAKSGTTAIANYLSENEAVFIPQRKECRFLSQMTPNFKGPADEAVNQSIVTNIEDYVEIFEGSPERALIGEASPDYLFFIENSLDSINKYYTPEKRPHIFVILRDPVQRAYSQYMHFRRDLRESLTFKDALNEENRRIVMNYEWAWQYKNVGLYSRQIKYLMENYPRDKIHVFIYEDYKNVIKIKEKIENILNVPTSPIKKVTRYNVSGIRRYPLLHDFSKKKMPLKNFSKFSA